MRRSIGIILIFVLVSVTLPTPATAAPQNDGWTALGSHVVVPGETLFCIGRAYGVDPWAIASANGLINPNVIHPGLTLTIPNVHVTLPPGPTCVRQFDGGAPPVTCGNCNCITQHLIVTGDTLYQIAARYETTIDELVHCNCIYNSNYIRIGDTLCIP